MIYLIKSAAFKEENEEIKFFFILKIGYTGDDEKTFKSRFGAYKLHNPTVEILYTIPGLTIEDEDKVQKRFKDYVFPEYGVEWFYYKDEIIEFFKLISEMSKEEVIGFIRDLIIESDKTIDSSLDLEERRFIYDNRSRARLVLARVLSSSECSRVPEINSILINSYENGYRDFSGLLDYIKKRYGDEIIREYEERMRVLESDPESKKVVEEYYECTTIKDKLKILCENEINDIILSNIPDNDELKSIYKVVGPEKIKATGYNITDIRGEFRKLTFNDVNMYVDIYTQFSIGDRIECSFLKEALKNIYNKNNYDSSIKAIDLGEYFIIKGIYLTFTTSTGEKKRGRGYEILDYKKDSKAYIAYQNYLMNQEALQNLIEQENRNNI